MIEGDSGTTTAQFTVTRSGNASATASVDIATADGTATVADNDYVDIALNTLVFYVGETTKTFDVIVNGGCGSSVNPKSFWREPPDKHLGKVISFVRAGASTNA